MSLAGLSGLIRPKALWAICLSLLLCLGRVYPCTIFCAAEGASVLVGNNEDYSRGGTILEFYPAAGGRRGRMLFRVGKKGYPFGGMNDRGLFFDWCALPRRADIAFPKGGRRYRGTLCEKMLAECSTVEEAIELYRHYDDPWLYEGHMLVADRGGASAVIEWGQDSLAVIGRTGAFQVLSNFNLSSPNLPGWYPCPRYDAAAGMLAGAGRYTVELFRRTLEAAHQEGANPTIHSEIYELDKGIVHVYLNHDFSRELRIDLAAELRKGRKTHSLSALFRRVPATSGAP